MSQKSILLSILSFASIITLVLSFSSYSYKACSCTDHLPCLQCAFVSPGPRPSPSCKRKFKSKSKSLPSSRVVLYSNQDGGGASNNEDEDSFDYDGGGDSGVSGVNGGAFSSYNMREYFATCIPGLSHILAQELIDIGAQNVEISGTSGVKFTSSSSSSSSHESNDDVHNVVVEEEDIGMKALMYVRTAHRIMELITSSTSTSNDDGEYDYDNYNHIHHITNRETLYDFIQSSMPPQTLQRLLGNGKNGLLTLNVQIIMNNAREVPKDLNHSHYTCLTVKNALVDLVRELRSDGMRPDVDLVDPDVPLMVVMRGVNNSRRKGGRQSYYRNQNQNYKENEYDLNNRNNDDSSVHVSLYRILHAGGSSLHRRGYRSSTNAIHKAAMKETLASGLLLQSGWDKLCSASRNDNLPAVLVDPMCGSGTFSVEAAMIAADYAPGLMRMRCFDKNSSGSGSGGNSDRWNPHHIPPVVRWKDSNRQYWKKLVLEARDRAASGMAWMRAPNLEFPHLSNCVIMANEMNPGAYELADANIINSGFGGMVSLDEGDCIDWHLNDSVVPGRTIVVVNPPWGLRLSEDIEESWLSLKSFLREECNEAEAWVLSGSKSATRYLRMKKTRSVVIKTAGEDLRWIQYHIFKKKAPV